MGDIREQHSTWTRGSRFSPWMPCADSIFLITFSIWGINGQEVATFAPGDGGKFWKDVSVSCRARARFVSRKASGGQKARVRPSPNSLISFVTPSFRQAIALRQSATG